MSELTTEDADDLLRWLNAHSVSISDGTPFATLQQKWMATQRPFVQLRGALESLFSQGLLVMTPGLEQPHVRLSTQGFEMLVRTMDAARQRTQPPATAAAPPSVAAAPATAPATAAAAAAPGSFNPAPLLVAPPAPAAAPPQAPVEAAPAPRRFVEHGAAPTEIGLRNQVLMIFRDLRLSAGQQLIATTLTRYWQEMGQRAEHLRAAIDIVLRDGYLQPTTKRYENYWMLTEAGHAYVKAPLSEVALAALAEPLLRIEDGHDEDDLRRRALKLLRSGASPSFSALASDWRLGRNALIHALDLLMKSGDVQLADGEPAAFRLTAAGASRR